MDQDELWTDTYDIHHCGEYTRFTTYCNSLANKKPVHMMVYISVSGLNVFGKYRDSVSVFPDALYK